MVNVPISENTDLFSGLGTSPWQLNPKNQITGLYTVQTYLKPNRNISARCRGGKLGRDDVFTIVQAP
jgi:hypothetical protein